MATTTLIAAQLLIDGQMVDAAGGETFETVSPATNRVVGVVAKAGVEDVNRAVAAARKAFDDGRWSGMVPVERSKRMRRVADIMRERVDELARVETLNCGKIIVESRADVLNGAACFDYYANLTGQMWGEQIPMNAPLLDYTVREPIGVCGQIIPWNFPILMAAWKLAPALATGNTIILKPASNTPITAVMLGQICQEAGIPDGVVNVLTGPGASIGSAICEHPDVDKIAFTGETETGRAISRQAAGTIKKISLELGGKSPNIIFPDADIEEAVNGSLFSVFTNAGQRCTARTRLFLHESIHDRFMADFVAKTAKIRIGDPLEWDTQMGPVISPSQCERVLSYVELARQGGADLAHGGRKLLVHQAYQRLTGIQRTHHLLTERLVLHPRDELAHHGQSHVGLEQGHAHLAQHVLHVGFGDARLATQRLDQSRQSIGEGARHVRSGAEAACARGRRRKQRKYTVSDDCIDHLRHSMVCVGCAGGICVGGLATPQRVACRHSGARHWMAAARPGAGVRPPPPRPRPRAGDAGAGLRLPLPCLRTSAGAGVRRNMLTAEGEARRSAFSRGR
jgi:acyl-CoA reductase-like NAD-dependent aldehyde dehydrogenase